MDLSTEERAVILAMRHTDRGGGAIYRYALGFDTYTVIDHDAPPYRENTPDRE